MAMHTGNTIVRVFKDHQAAQEAVRRLKAAGFRDDQIGVASSNNEGLGTHTESDDEPTSGDESANDTYAGEGAFGGIAAGAGVGALWGLGILAGVLPGIGPAIAGGTLAVLLSSAAAGAAAAGLTGALIGAGIPKEEAEFYESEMRSGNIIVTVDAGDRSQEARTILDSFGGYDMQSRDTQSVGGTHQGSNPYGDLAGRGTRSGSRETETNADQTIRAHAEEIHVKKTPVQTGEVEVRKEVHTDHKTIDVPVSREEIVVERHAGKGQAASGADFQEGRQEIRIPVSKEEVDIEKEVVVNEEVSIGKRKVQDTEAVKADARREEIKVEKHGDARIRDDEDEIAGR